jgi:hypothetical protein
MILRPGRANAAAAMLICLFALGLSSAAHAADQVLVGADSVSFAWSAASGSPSGYLVSRSLNGGAFQTYAFTGSPTIDIPVSVGDQIAIQVAATGYDSTGAYRVGPSSPVSDRITVAPVPLFAVSGWWLLRCATCNTVMDRSLGNAALVTALSSGPLGSTWRVLGVAKLQNGRDQIIWQNATTGTFSIYDREFLAPITGFTGSGPAALRAVGAADFDNDGMDEFVVQATDTGVAMAYAANAGRFEYLATIPGPTTSALIAVADFDRDGKVDLLWYDPIAHTLDLWKLAKDPTLGYPLTTLISKSVRVASGLAIDAMVAGTGDYDGDGNRDVLWRYGDGRLAITYLSLGVPLRYVALASAAGDIDRRVIGSVDIGGTPGDEIAVQEKVSGLIWILDPQTNGAVTRTMVLHPGSEWKVVAVGQ